MKQAASLQGERDRSGGRLRHPFGAVKETPSWRQPWALVLLGPFAVSLLLLVLSQALFLEGSLHEDLGMGMLDPSRSLANFRDVLTSSAYLRALATSVQVSALSTVLTLSIAFPFAYILARMNGSLPLVLIAAVVISSFVSTVVKVLGLMLIFGSNGPINGVLIALGIVTTPLTIIGTVPGVVLGLMYYTLGFAILLFYSMILTIPRSLEEAAAVHGASRLGAIRQVVLPLCLPGIAAGALTVFSVSMGGFSSTALIGAGRVLTLPIMVQRTVLTETNYGLGAAVAILLLAAVLAVNVAATVILARSRRGMVV